MAKSQSIIQEFPFWFTQRAESRLIFLYGEERTKDLMNRLLDRMQHFSVPKAQPLPEYWNEQDVILITYGDNIRQTDAKPLATLYEFSLLHLKDCINSIHVLPYFPFSSDDGFAVIDYKTVDPQLGDWRDIERIAQDFSLMTDLVINHVSRENLWFIDYLSHKKPACDYFIELPENTDVSSVVRPRSTPVLVPAHTHQGVRYVWATFGEDQIDVNFANPDVLFEFIDILLLYIEKGSRFIRLDAVAFLWKKLDTRCINLRETHEVVKLLRDIVDLIAPDTVLITETNVPNGENLSYFGNSDEAHMVYQFTLPPLLLHALYQGNSDYLTRWAKDMPRPQKNCTYLNFIASHDGIGLRPAEGILPEQEVKVLVDAMHEYGGYVSTRTGLDGRPAPYEINIALFDALKGTSLGLDQWQIQRFICAHTIMISLQGIPAIYINSLIATANDYHGVEQSGKTRSINRHKWEYSELMDLLNNPHSPNAIIFHEFKRLLSIRRRQAAFHPDSAQETLSASPALFSFWRTSPDHRQRILVVSNITPQRQTMTLPNHPRPEGSGLWRDLIERTAINKNTAELILYPYQTAWLEALD
ncbi:sugar phosphorylase [Methylotuvimicrobium alcaliphilum]|uniref:Sucrose phosphorylase n=1 Tax=Methylotuvimicrobium alcaliphilum (strain DSM 19304 / NCIMB 14124 / VKM B-2133 / 20Z) TaxID=1091494 RepID=G4T0D2_META2|nr:sugar phosphorylase [Methylotuvimicrobium alcaliphilum]CCE24524.1 putative sucrose phosphorylase [Methylotuvimicrobium alcaliphilum 20Z]